MQWRNKTLDSYVYGTGIRDVDARDMSCIECNSLSAFSYYQVFIEYKPAGGYFVRRKGGNMNLDSIAIICSHIDSNNSRLFKEQQLRKYEGVEGFKEVLQFIYNKDAATGIGKKKLDALYPTIGRAMSPEEMMEYLTINNTGSDMDVVHCLNFICQYESATTQWLAEALVTKDLQIGVTATTLNKVYGKGFIPKIGIMKGVPLKDVTLNGVYIATEKIDGNRRLVFTKPTGVEIYTRSGKRDYGLVDIMEAAHYLPVGYVFDTECVAMGDFKDSIALRQASASLLNSGGNRTGVVAKIFDMIPIAEYNVGKSRDTALIRKSRLASLFDDCNSMYKLQECLHARNLGLHANTVNALQHCWQDYMVVTLKEILRTQPVLEPLPILGLVSTEEEAMALAQPIWDNKGEGIMLNLMTAPYEVKEARCKHLVKVKGGEEGKYAVIGILEGDKSFAGMLGALTVSLTGPDGKQYSCNVGSGFTFAQRQKIWDNYYDYQFKQIEVEHFGVSQNQQGGYALNCPIFKRFVGDVD